MGKKVLLLIIFFGAITATYGQYFGQNKPSYRTFDFKVYHTPHFEIYHYLKNDSVLNRLAQLSEQWYTMHQAMFGDTFKTQNPIIFYNDHADFQQTTAVSGLVDVGTGGVTEGLKNRVVLPIASSYAQTDHVLGHEMVHAFQYHLLLGDSGNYNAIRNIPLWMIEGMAEYFSIGSVDAHTALWMRDAIVNNDFPTLEMMSTSYKYFPYRFGQSFWSMIGRTWGDSTIMKLFKAASTYGYPYAINQLLGYDENSLSDLWKQSLVSHYQKYIDLAITTPVGKKILFAKNAGDMNISPSVSPDGKHVIFLSEKEIFTLDLYLADAETGRIIRKISSVIHNSEVDAFNYIESAGSWSPDGKNFVFTVFADGRNKLLMVNVEKGKTVGEFDIPGVPAFSNPAWSPINNNIVVTGTVEGITNLYLFNLDSKEVTKLTDDPFSYMQPMWSNDGKHILFSTDKPTQPGEFIDPAGGIKIGMMDVATKQITTFNFFEGAKNLNPVFAPDNKSFYFLSNRDGFRNLYRYHIDSAKMYQYTRFFTGITGITEFSPAVTVARDKDLINYTYFYGGKYSIYSAGSKDFKPFEVNPDSVDFTAATLPPLKRSENIIVDKQLYGRDTLKLMGRDNFMISPYRPKFRLDYISQVNVGVGSSRFGSGMAGSVLGIFSDMVGQNQLYAMLGMNGQIYDFGGQVAYLNSENKINWGVTLSHIPYSYSYYSTMERDSIKVNDTLTYFTHNHPINNYRIFEDKISLFALRPFSKTQRLEFGISQIWQYYRHDVINQRYLYDADLDTNLYNDTYLDEYSGKEKRSTPPGFSIQTIDAAYVFDNSLFGMTGPINGARTRFGVEKYFGEFGFFTGLIDIRQYWYKKPATFALRLMHYGRYGKGDDDFRLNRLYLGYSWYMRGYSYETFTVENNIPDSLDVNLNDLSGNKIGLFNFEVRLPFTGPKKIALIPSNFLMSDLVLFVDAGLAWDNNHYPKFGLTKSKETDRVPLISTGISLRINLFGYIIIEPYYAFPLQYGGLKSANFGLNFQPGW